MTTHMAGPREEWLGARLDLRADEKELTRPSDITANNKLSLARQGGIFHEAC